MFLFSFKNSFVESAMLGPEIDTGYLAFFHPLALVDHPRPGGFVDEDRVFVPFRPKNSELIFSWLIPDLEAPGSGTHPKRYPEPWAFERCRIRQFSLEGCRN